MFDFVDKLADVNTQLERATNMIGVRCRDLIALQERIESEHAIQQVWCLDTYCAVIDALPLTCNYGYVDRTCVSVG